MRVIIAHNFYRSDSPSGENAVVEFEAAALRERGLDVVELFRRSDDIPTGSAGRARLAMSPTRNAGAVAELRRIVATRPADILHVHNLFPLISPAILLEARRLGIPTVATVHNHRYYCMAATLRRDAHPCTECIDFKTPLPGVLHSCYRGSRLQATSMAVALTRHATTLRTIDRYIALSTDLAERLTQFGVPADRIRIKPNTVEDPGDTPPPGTDLLFVGRLTEEKGVRLLVQAWGAVSDNVDARLVLAGDGPLRAEVEAAAHARDDIVYVGSVPPTQVQQLLARAGAVLVPSLWSEAFPRVVVEAMAHGRGVVTTPMGSMPEIVGNGGWVVEPSVEAWAATLSKIAASPEARATVGAAARARFDRRYAREVVMDQLIDIYCEARASAL